MAKMLTLVAFLVGISCALAQNNVTSSESAMLLSTGFFMATPTASSAAPPSTTQPSPSSPPHRSTPMPSPTPMPSHTPVPSHTPMPSPTPTPAPPPPQEHQFFLNYTGTGRLCLHMEAAFDIEVNYTNHTNHTEILHNKFMLSDNIKTDDESMCNKTLAKLLLSWRNDSNFILTFTFNTSDPNHNSYWQEGDVTFNYDITPQWFPGYDGNLTSGEVEFGYSKLVDDANSHIEFNRSYQCNGSRNFAGHDARTNFSFILNMRNFSVQAFSFRNSSSGQFESPRTCEGGNTSKIVPIAVGAALAGLVIVVLIAYLIGRFRNRKQSSYEALS